MEILLGILIIGGTIYTFIQHFRDINKFYNGPQDGRKWKMDPYSMKWDGRRKSITWVLDTSEEEAKLEKERKEKIKKLEEEYNKQLTKDFFNKLNKDLKK